MAADILIHRLTGAGPTGTNITSTTTRASTSDSATPGTSDPIPIPAAGTNYSYWVSTQLYADTLPAGTINNLRWYSDGGNGFGTGVTCVGYSAAAYVQATGTQGESGDELTEGNHAQLNDAPEDVFGFTSGSPLSLTGEIDSEDAADSLFGHLFVYQLAVGTTAGPGTTSAETFSWSYDET